MDIINLIKEFKLSFLATFIFIFLGCIIKFFPSQYGSRNGYNTITSRKSKEIWDYAQKNFLIHSIRAGFLVIIINTIIVIGGVLLLNKLNLFEDYRYIHYTTNTTQSLIMLYMFYGMEKELKQKFNLKK